MRQLNHLLPFGKKPVIGRVVLFPNPFKLVLKSLHIHGILYNQHILPVALDGLGGPVERAGDEHPAVHDGELVVHVAAVLVVSHLDPCGDTDTAQRSGPSRSAPAPAPPLTRVAQAADLGAVQPHVLSVRHQADTDPAPVQQLHGPGELRAGEGEQAEIERAAGGEEAANQAAQGGVAARQRARAGPGGRAGLGRLGQQRLDAAGP